MANEGPQSYSNTCWMISGTSKIWLKSGPVALLIITNMLQKIQANYGIILENIMYVNMRPQKSEILRKCMSYVPYLFYCSFFVKQ